MNEPTNQPTPSTTGQAATSAAQAATATQPATAEDRRWALLAYLFTPVVPLLLFFVEPARDRPFVHQHMIQALALGVVQVALLILAPFTFCISTVVFLLVYVGIFYWGFRAYNGELFEIPYVTDYLRKQNWL
jgi:uncharacterized protein